MPTINPQRQHSTRSVGIRQYTAPYTRSSSYNENHQVNTHDVGYFPLRPTQFPNGTPEVAKRSRKVYSDLADEREYLLKLRELWVAKLDNLKQDSNYLTKMKDIKKDELIGVGPLFSRGEEPPENQYSDAQTPIGQVTTSQEIQTPIKAQYYQTEFDVDDNTQALETIASLRAYHGITEKETDNIEIEANDDLDAEEVQRRALQNLIEQHGYLFNQ